MKVDWGWIGDTVSDGGDAMLFGVIFLILIPVLIPGLLVGLIVRGVRRLRS